MTEFGKSPLLRLEELGELGYRMVIFPQTAFRVSMNFAGEMLAELKSAGTQEGWLDRMQTRKELYEMLDYDPTQVKRESMSTETKPAYSPGLAGVIAGETAICWVDPNAGLMYRGYDIHEMAEKANFEEVAYLLLNGELPNAGELPALSAARSSRNASLPKAVLRDAAALAEEDASDGCAAHRRFDARGFRS